VRLRWRPRAIPLHPRPDDRQALGRWLSLAKWREIAEPEIKVGMSPIEYCDTFPFAPSVLGMFAPTRQELGHRALAELSRLGVVCDGAIVTERDDNVGLSLPFLVTRNSFQSSPPQPIRHVKDVSQ
jgi:hypothetical protein